MLGLEGNSCPEESILKGIFQNSQYGWAYKRHTWGHLRWQLSTIYICCKWCRNYRTFLAYNFHPLSIAIYSHFNFIPVHRLHNYPMFQRSPKHSSSSLCLKSTILSLRVKTILTELAATATTTLWQSRLRPQTVGDWWSAYPHCSSFSMEKCPHLLQRVTNDNLWITSWKIRRLTWRNKLKNWRNDSGFNLWIHHLELKKMIYEANQT